MLSRTVPLFFPGDDRDIGPRKLIKHSERGGVCFGIENSGGGGVCFMGVCFWYRKFECANNSSFE